MGEAVTKAPVTGMYVKTLSAIIKNVCMYSTYFRPQSLWVTSTALACERHMHDLATTIHEGRVEVGPHLLTLPLKLAGGEDHVGGSTMTTEAALAFWQEALFQMFVQAVEENASEELPDEFQQGEASVVVAELAVPFPLVEVHD
ncbi:hypothetical protein SprV_0100246000 [Sparganum proliferum]